MPGLPPPLPYIKGVGKLKTLLRCIKTYLSRGNVEGPLDTWIEAKDVDDPGNKDGAQFDETVTISISRATMMLAALEYLEAKTGLALLAAQKFDHYNAEYLQVDSLHNQIIRGTKTKAMALGMVDYLIQENDETFILFRNFLTKEPLREQYEGAEMLLGRGISLKMLTMPM